MEPNEALGIAAQVAVTLVGFAGIMVVFRPKSVHEWAAIDRLRLILLLTNSLLPLFFSLFGMALLTVQPPPDAIWRWCSGVAILAQISMIAIGSGMSRQLASTAWQGVTRVFYYTLFVLGLSTTVLQVVNVLRWNVFWPFFIAIFWHLTAALLQFARFILLSHQSE